LVWFIPLQGLLLIQMSMTLSDMSDSLFTAPTHRNACYYYDDGLRSLINDDDDFIIMMLFTFQLCLFT
jgi:hypothetical protein